METVARAPLTLPQIVAYIIGRISPGPFAMFVVLAVVTAVLVISPLVVLLLQSITRSPQLALGSTDFTLNAYSTLFSSGNLPSLILNTLQYAFGSVVVALVIAGTLSWLTERSNLPFITPIRVALFCLMSVPALLIAFGWIFALNPNNGVINIALMNLLGLAESPLNIYTMRGMIFVTGFGIVPTMWTMLSGVFRNMDPELEQAGAVSGAGGVTILRKITLPLLLPGLLSVGIYIFIILFQAFDIPLAIGLTAREPVLATRLYLLAIPEIDLPNYSISSTLGVVLLVLALVMMWGYIHVTRVSTKFQVVTGKGYRPTRRDLGTWRYPAFAGVMVYFAILSIPFLILFWTSLLPFYENPSLDALDSVSLDNYRRIIGLPQVRDSAQNTLVLALSSATACMVFSSVVSWFAIRSRIRGARILEVLTFLPLAVPNIVFALAILLLAIRTPIWGTMWTLILAHTTVYLAYGTRTMSTAIMQIHVDLEHAATVSGAPWRVNFQKIVMPLIWHSFVSGWVWIFIHSMRDFTIPLMLMTKDTVVVSTLLWQMWNFADFGGAAALAMLMAGGLVLLVIPTQVFFIKRGIEA